MGTAKARTKVSSAMADELNVVNLFGDCNCEQRYTIEPHGKGYALYLGRCPHRHGYNLVNMVEPAWNFDPKYIEELINKGAEADER